MAHEFVQSPPEIREQLADFWTKFINRYYPNQGHKIGDQQLISLMLEELRLSSQAIALLALFEIGDQFMVTMPETDRPIEFFDKTLEELADWIYRNKGVGGSG